MTNFNLSQNTTIGIASLIRMAYRKRKIIEPNSKDHLAAAIHSFIHDFIEVKNFDFVNVSGTTSYINKKVIMCKDLRGVLQFVKAKGEVTDTHLKFGNDGGGGFLKVCLSIQSTENDPESNPKRRKYADSTVTR